MSHRDAEHADIAIIGGSGLSRMKGLENRRVVPLPSTFGKPSDDGVIGSFAGQSVVFLPRHGPNHSIPPSQINYRANIDALKRLGVRQIIAVNAVGSLREEMAPGTLVIPDQFIDRTFARDRSFFTAGCVAHVSMADPVCGRIGAALESSSLSLSSSSSSSSGDERIVRGGTYIVIEGPQFSTRAESDFYRSLGCHIIGMTALPEAHLAREAEICYATIAMVTDYDCWHPRRDDVDVEDILAVMEKNGDAVERLLSRTLPKIAIQKEACSHGCSHALDRAVVTLKTHWEPKQIERLDAVAGRLLRHES